MQETVALWVHEYKRPHPESYSKTQRETYYDEAIILNKEKGMGAAEISKIVPASAATISVWLRIFPNLAVCCINVLPHNTLHSKVM